MQNRVKRVKLNRSQSGLKYMNKIQGELGIKADKEIDYILTLEGRIRNRKKGSVSERVKETIKQCQTNIDN